MTNSTYYITTDHLGSGDLILDSAGVVLARESFTPFGARRGSNWQGLPSAGDKTVFGDVTRRGFTGHEMLDAVTLIHMNGRVYDPQLGRFLSADPIIQTIALSQALNPFAYVLNNPLTLIDPSGYSFLGKLFHSIGHFFKRFFRALLHDLNVIVGFTLVIIGTIIPNPALVAAGIKIASFPVHATYRSGRVGVGFGYTFSNVPVSTGPLWTAGGSSAPPPNWVSGGPGVIAGVPVLYVNATAQSAYSPAPPELIGTRDYYIWRYENAPDSYRNATGREYYLQYGLRKFDEFQRLREGASPELQEFIDRTGRELQLRLEGRLQLDPTIGLRRASLYRAAIDVHSDAYRAGGFWDLPRGDILKVLKTIGPDLLRPETIREGVESIIP